MAVDTRNKRFSMLSWGRPWLPTLPNPSGTIDEPAREQLQFLYSGILSASPTVPVVTALLLAYAVFSEAGYAATVSD